VAHKLTDSNLISRRLGSTHKVLAASPGYLERFGVPTELQDLKNHRCLGFDRAVNGGTIWRFRGLETRIDIPCSFPFAANNTQALVLAACLDNGIIYLPEICISNELAQQRLEPVLLDAYVPESYGIFAVYPHRNAAAKVKVLVNFIERELSSLRINDRGTPFTGSIGHYEQCVDLN
jgi:DNA-binding transcriptional LysR family regulator